MSRFYYLHLWTSGEIDAKTKVIDTNIHPVKVEDIGLEFHDWYSDDLFRSFPVFVCTERLKSLLIYEGFEKLSFTIIERINKGYDFKDNYPDSELGKFWLVDFNGECGKDDFALWQGLYPVVSDKGLVFLRDNNVNHAEVDEITEEFENYFSSDKKNFWM